MRNARLIVLAAVFLATSSAAFQGETVALAEQCTASYAGNLSRISQYDRATATIFAMRSHTCSAQNQGLSAGFDSRTQGLINGVPGLSSLLGSANITNNKQLCEAISRDRFEFSRLSTNDVEPAETAMAALNACYDIASRANLVLSYRETDAGAVAISGSFNRPEQSVRLSVQTTGGFRCRSPHPVTGRVEELGADSIVRSNANFAILCDREPITTDGGPEYPEGRITIVPSQGGIYPIVVAPNQISNLASRQVAQRRLAELQREFATVKARLEGRQVKAVRWYYGQTDAPLFIGQPGGGALGRRMSCSRWSGVPQAQRVEFARQQLCPSGRLVAVEMVRQFGGGNCGYTFFSGVCETTPN